MTQVRILSRQPSIQNIQIKQQAHKGLTQIDVNKLFVNKSLPKFQLTDIKLHSIFFRKQKSHFFVSLVEKWNRMIQQSTSLSLPTNIRTQYLLIEFIYLSLKRICLMPQPEIEKQLNILYKWFSNQTKNNPCFVCPSMPSKVQQNQHYNVTKSFKTNPALMVNEYKRKTFGPQSSQVQKRQIKSIDKNNINNFLTQVVHKQNKNNYVKGDYFNLQDKRMQAKCLLLKRQQNKVRQEQLRRYIQKKQIEQKQWCFKAKKGRLLSQTSKNYFSGNFNTSIRKTNSSQSNRNGSKNRISQFKPNSRSVTSHGKRGSSLNPIQQKKYEFEEINEINSFGLLTNPFQIKIKKKKKLRK